MAIFLPYPPKFGCLPRIKAKKAINSGAPAPQNLGSAGPPSRFRGLNQATRPHLSGRNRFRTYPFDHISGKWHTSCLKVAAEPGTFNPSGVRAVSSVPPRLMQHNNGHAMSQMQRAGWMARPTVTSPPKGRGRELLTQLTDFCPAVNKGLSWSFKTSRPISRFTETVVIVFNRFN